METENILIAEKEPEVRDMMAVAVKTCGHISYFAADGAQVIELLGRNQFDIVIYDMSLPDLSGSDLMRRIREFETHPACLIMTGYGHDYRPEIVFGTGAQDFLKKPFTLDEFSKKLSRIVFQRQLEKENHRLQKKQIELNRQLASLLSVAADLTSELDFDRLFPMIIQKVSEAMSAQRTSLYLIDWEKGRLWTKVAEGINPISLDVGEGISGRVAQTGVAVSVRDAWTLPYFNKEYDQRNRFRTRSVLCVPVKNHHGDRIGVLQVINKTTADHFDKNDEALLMGLSSQVGIALENSLLHEELWLSFDSSIRTLSAVQDTRHPLTAGHSRRVTDYCLLIAQEMGLSDEICETLKYAALLHDIGKIGIRDEILLKNGPFSPQERAEMNTHPVKSKVILENFRFPKALKHIPTIALHHHEKVNGKGYPSGLCGDKLPICSKIMAVADVFDALTSRRDYPKYPVDENGVSCEPMPLRQVLRLLRDLSGVHFESGVVEAFFRCLPQALLKHRGGHFSPEYVDGTIRTMAPKLLDE